jgi:hypothetical protein
MESTVVEVPDDNILNVEYVDLAEDINETPAAEVEYFDVPEVTITDDEPAAVDTEPTEIKYGPDGNGGYITPFEITWIIKSNNKFTLELVALTNRPQIVTVGDEFSIDDCEYLTPEVIISADTGLTYQDMLKLFEKGFQFIHCLTLPGSPIPDVPAEEDRVVLFQRGDIPEHIIVLPGLTPMFLLDMLLLYYVVGYTPTTQHSSLTRESAVYFFKGIQSLDESVCTTIVKLCTNFRAFDHITELITTGKVLISHEESTINRLLESSVIYTGPNDCKICAIESNYVNLLGLSSLAPVHPRLTRAGVNFLLVYYYLDNPGPVSNKTRPLCGPGSNTTRPLCGSGWHIDLLQISELSPVSCDELLGEYQTDTCFKSKWLSIEDSKGLLTFIYPQ